MQVVCCFWRDRRCGHNKILDTCMRHCHAVYFLFDAIHSPFIRWDGEKRTDDGCFLRSQLEFVTTLNAAQTESTAGTESKARRHENHKELRARSVRTFHSASKSRKSSSPQRRSSPKACERIATPHIDSRASNVKVKPTDARTERPDRWSLWHLWKRRNATIPKPIVVMNSQVPRASLCLLLQNSPRVESVNFPTFGRVLKRCPKWLRVGVIYFNWLVVIKD